MSAPEGILASVEDAFRTMPGRYVGAPNGTDAVVQVRLTDIGRVWEVRLRPERCTVRGGASREPDVTVVTDAVSWLRLREGGASGLDLYSIGLVSARGDLDLAVGLEGHFFRPDGSAPTQRLHDVVVDGTRISTLTMGTGEEHAILIHGLGGTKASMYETVSALAPVYTVHAIDLPGFGSSSKPARAAYDAAYFADKVFGLMDELGIERARLVGNSMGGRAALEMGLTRPERVIALGLLAPAMAFVRKREWVPLVRVLRPELALLPHTLRRENVRASFENLFANPDRVDPDVAEVVADEFLRIYGSPAARLAFYTAARNVYLERPFGKDGFWPRLANLRTPALFIWGGEDRLVPAAFARRVTEALPTARNVVLRGCGHVPQVELPERTHALLRGFFDDQAAGVAKGRRRPAAVERRSA